MDDHQFDRLTRQLAKGRSRRSVLKAIAGGIGAGVASLVGAGSAGAAPKCRTAGHPCEGNQICCPGLVCTVTGPGNARRCSACPAGQIECGGRCIEACRASDQCHVAGVCDPATGTCTNPIKPNGSACDDGNACTENDTCQNGTCQPGTAANCDDGNPCTTDTCDPDDGCVNTPVDGCVSCDEDGACEPSDNPCIVVVCNDDGICESGLLCGEDLACCPTEDGEVQCCPAGQTCCGDVCCTPETCCLGSPGQGACYFEDEGEICCGLEPGFGDPLICRDGEVCTDDGCCDPAQVCVDACCTGNQVCDGEMCCVPNSEDPGVGVEDAACESDDDCCNGTCCVDQLGRQYCTDVGGTDDYNCGACGFQCGSGQECIDGECICADGSDPCGEDPVSGLGTCCPAGFECDELTGVCFVPCSTGACTTNEECCNGICTCNDPDGPPNPEAGHCQTPFFQGFETDTAGWNGVTRVPSGTNGVPSNASTHHGEVAPGTFVAFTRWGGYTNTFPPTGYTTSVDIYLDMSPGVPNDTRFDWTSAVNAPDCNHRRDFVFNAGYYDDTDVTGAGPRYVISASNGAGRSAAFPKNPGRDPFAVVVEGWYTFEHHFTNVGGQLVVVMTLSGPGGIHSWTLTDPTDIIGATVGGNRYGGFAPSEFPALPIDNSARV